MENDPKLWEAMRALAVKFELEDRSDQEPGIILDPQYGDEFAYAVLQVREDGRLTLGLKDGRLLVEPCPE